MLYNSELHQPLKTQISKIGIIDQYKKGAQVEIILGLVYF